MEFPLGLCVLSEAGPNRARSVSYANYASEILTHAGLFHAAVPQKGLEARLGELRILVTIGEAEFSDAMRRKLATWVEGGGAWLAVSGSCGMDELLGVKRMESTYRNWGGGVRSLGEGYLSAKSNSHPILAHLNRPLHFFGGVAVEAKGADVLAGAQDAHGRDTDRAAIVERAVGKGRVVLIAADLTGTVVFIQQGRGGVTRDGVPSPDGTAPVNDSVLKSDDGAVLDWILDREPVPGAEGLSMFAQPVADGWREIFIRSVFHLAKTQATSLPVLWYWPRKLPAVGHLSHDTDGNDPKLAQRLYDTLAQCEVKSTWCVILPGYDAALMAKIKAAGHELATHFDAMTEGHPWGEAHFDHQVRELTKMFGQAPVTNKNHYLRWEGDTDIWDWCAKRSIQLDQSKGASKTGEAGFNFGTCHPYFPVRFDGSTIDVLELATPTQDLEVFAPAAIFETLLAQAKKYHGVLHLLFHPAHFDKPAVPAAMSMAVKRGREEGLEWWTGSQINAWERARRKVTLKSFDESSVTLKCEAELADATTLVFSPTGRGNFKAWGFDFTVARTTIER